MDLEEARRIAMLVLEVAQPSCERIIVAGSIRRMKPNPKDIEIVAIVKNYDTLFRDLSQLGQFIKPSVPDIVPWNPKPGAKYLRMLLHSGIKLDFFVASPENWGALLTMRTGPAQGPDGEYGFVPAMFAAWKRRSEGGRMLGCVPTRPDGTGVPVPEERDFFELCGVKWVEPAARISSRDIKRI